MKKVKVNTLMTYEGRLAATRLINSWKYPHNNSRGFIEFKPDTPDYIKTLEQQIFATMNAYNKIS